MPGLIPVDGIDNEAVGTCDEGNGGINHTDFVHGVSGSGKASASVGRRTPGESTIGCVHNRHFSIRGRCTGDNAPSSIQCIYSGKVNSGNGIGGNAFGGWGDTKHGVVSGDK